MQWEEESVAEAATHAELLAKQISIGDGALDPVYRMLDDSLKEFYNADIDPVDLLPVSDEPGAGFSFKRTRNGRTFWDAIAQSARKKICGMNDQVEGILGSGGQGATAGLITWIATTLGLPPAANSIAVAIAGVILSIGLSGFCDWAGD